MSTLSVTKMMKADNIQSFLCLNGTVVMTIITTDILRTILCSVFWLSHGRGEWRYPLSQIKLFQYKMTTFRFPSTPLSRPRYLGLISAALMTKLFSL